MRHKRRSRVLGRSPSHRKALLRNLASALFLTEGDFDEDLDENIPKVKGRITTTLHKAKEVRPLVEKCITIARRSLKHEEEAQQYATTAERGSAEWKDWRTSEQWQKWNHAISPAVAARRRALQLLGNKQAVRILFDEVAPRFEDREGGYTRVLRLAEPRLGDAGVQAILEFVGKNDREKVVSEKPTFSSVASDEDVADQPAGASETEDDRPEEQEAEAQATDSGAAADDSADEQKQES